MKLTKSDQIFITILPAVAIALLYWLCLARPAAKHIGYYRTDIESIGPAENLRAEYVTLSAQQSALKETHDALAAQRKADAGTPQTGTNQAGAAPRLRALHDAFRAHGVTITSATFDDTTRAAARQTSRVWTLTLSADYENMTRLLAHIAAEFPGVVPESVTMKTSSVPGKPIFWRLTLCL